MRMPVMFMGHGSPMNAIETNTFTETWRKLGEQIARPRAILAISAHWYGHSERVQQEAKPRQVYDMYGFPEELYQCRYEPNGDHELSERVLELVDNIVVDNSWGIDHGTWGVLVHMFPDASIPVVQLAINMDMPLEKAVAIGKALAPLRDEGYLILGSGNIVHNLRRVEWNRQGGTETAERFDGWVKSSILNREFAPLAAYADHPDGRYAVPTTDHYLPLLYTLGAVAADDTIEVVNEACMMGSLSMTSYVFKAPASP